MNKDRLEKLKARAAQAVKVAAEIELLKEANPHGYGTTVKFTKDGISGEQMPESLLKSVVEAGRQHIIKQDERLLESLLSTEPEEAAPPAPQVVQPASQPASQNEDWSAPGRRVSAGVHQQPTVH